MKTKAYRMLLAFAVLGFLFSLPQAASGERTLYFTDADNGDTAVGKILRTNLGGTDLTALVPPGLSPRFIELNLLTGKMYWTDIGGISRANLDGSELETDLIRAGLAPMGIALERWRNRVYWTDESLGLIQRADITQRAVETVVAGLQAPRGLALDDGAQKIYWTDMDTHKVQRANLDGSDVEDLVVVPNSWPQGIALDVPGGRMYWVAFDGWLRSAQLDGSFAVQHFYTGSAIGLALDAASGKVYWTNSADGEIRRANLDGSDQEVLVSTDIDTPWGIALILDSIVRVEIAVEPPGGQDAIVRKPAEHLTLTIFSSEKFDALTVRVDTIRLTAAPVKSPGRSQNYLCRDRDVNRDGLVDLVCTVKSDQLELDLGAEFTLVMTALTTDGFVIHGFDTWPVVSPPGKGRFTGFYRRYYRDK